jgi:glyoxalase family protein
MSDNITGLHHITVVAGDPQENLDFYVGVMGMRLVKKTVNQDVPGTYHLFYADGAAHAGTDLTFFPWPDMAPGQAGVGLTVEVVLAVNGCSPLPIRTAHGWRWFRRPTLATSRHGPRV